MTRYGDSCHPLAYAHNMRPNFSHYYLNVMTSLPLLAVTDSVFAASEETGVAGGRFTYLLLFSGIGILLALLLRNRAAPCVQSVSRWLGSRRVKKAIRRSGLQCLDNFILPGTCDGLNRVDHAVLTSGGIICIRAKTCSGMIFGTARDPQWTNVDGTERTRFLNPLIQNAGRVSTLQKVVGEMPVESLVVFSGDVQFPVTPAGNIIHVSQLQAWLVQYQQNSSCAADPEAAWHSLRAVARTDSASRKDFESQLSFG